MKPAIVTLLFASVLCWTAAAQSPSAALDDIQHHLDAKDWKGAEATAEAFLKEHPSNPAALVKRGQALHGEGNYREAINSYQEAIKAGAPAVMLDYRIAASNARLGDKEKALELLQQAAQNGILLGANLQDPDLDSLRSDSRFAAIVAQDDKNQRPCGDPGHRQFDFWVGEWDVHTLDGNKVGDSHIQRILNDCIILETWNPGKGVREGQSFNYYDPARNKWTQFWVDAQGSNTQFVDGEFKDNALRFWGHNPGNDGKPALQRFTFFNLGPDKVRQLQEQSQDEGKSWTTVYDFYYYRKKTE